MNNTPRRFVLIFVLLSLVDGWDGLMMCLFCVWLGCMQWIGLLFCFESLGTRGRQHIYRAQVPFKRCRGSWGSRRAGRKWHHQRHTLTEVVAFWSSVQLEVYVVCRDVNVGRYLPRDPWPVCFWKSSLMTASETNPYGPLHG